MSSTLSEVVAPAGLSFDVEEVTRLADLEAVRAEWSALCDRCPAITPFQRPDWLIAWWRAFQPAEPWVVLLRREGRLVGVAPLLFYSNGGERTAAFLGGGVSDYLDVVFDPAIRGEAAEALFGLLAEQGGRWQVCDFEPLPPDSPLLQAQAPLGWGAEAEPRDVCPALHLPSRLEDLGEVVPTRQLANLRKFRRKAAALGDLRTDVADENGWEEALEALIRLHEARWASQGQPGVLQGAALRAFHREVAQGFLARGALLLLALRLDGETIAVLYGFQEGSTVYCYLQGFEPRFEKLSPGVMVVGAAVEEAVQRGARTLDFLRGKEEYKYRWGAKDRVTWRKRLRRL
jgi:CelD/BcsL family acetyltransferase involved in cellulose biosynthesis